MAGILILAALLAVVLHWGIRKPSVRFSEREAFQEEAFDLTLRAGWPEIGRAHV